MPKLLHVNVVANTGSTGRLAESLISHAADAGWDTYFAYGRAITQTRATPIRIGSRFDNYKNALLARVFDNEGFNAKSATKKFVEEIKKVSPDIIHLHNLHGYYINLEILFAYLRESEIPVVWTLHDCWTFTGHCAYYDLADCAKWRTQCSNCPQYKDYPASFSRDNSRNNFLRKKRLFNSLENLTLAPVSYWLENDLRNSFLQNQKIRMIHNGLDVSKFKQISDVAAVRQKYGITKPKVMLGVSNVWHDAKGLGDFCKLSKMIPDDCQIVLVGVNDEVRKILPPQIVVISRTESVEELAKLYSLADVFVNPTYQEAFGMVNIEALSCGTPVATYNSGGSPETVDPNTGIVVEKGNLNALMNAAISMASKKNAELSEACRMRAETFFSTEVYCKNYMELYNSLIDKSLDKKAAR